MALPQPTPLSYTELSLLSEGGFTLGTYKLLSGLNNYMLRNVQPMQPVLSEIQTYQGDEMFNIGEHEIEILLEGDLTSSKIERIELETDLLDQLLLTKKLSTGQYEQEVAIIRGISSVEPVSVRSKYKYRATILYIPTTGFWTSV